MEPKIKFAAPLDQIERLRTFTSSEETRYYLRGIHYSHGEDGAAVLAATDGHRLGVLRCDEAFAVDTGILRLPVAKVKASDTHKGWRKWLVVGTFGDSDLGLICAFPPSVGSGDVRERVLISDALLIYPRPLIDGQFPNWRQAVPAQPGKIHGGFNSAYVGSFAKAGRGEKSVAVTLHGDDPSAPNVVTIGDPNFIGVLMPIRTEGLASIPDWLFAPKQEAA